MNTDRAARADLSIYLIIISIILFIAMILLIIVLCIREIQPGFCAEHIDVFWQMVEDSRKERDLLC